MVKDVFAKYFLSSKKLDFLLAVLFSESMIINVKTMNLLLFYDRIKNKPLSASGPAICHD